MSQQQFHIYLPKLTGLLCPKLVKLGCLHLYTCPCIWMVHTCMWRSSRHGWDIPNVPFDQCFDSFIHSYSRCLWSYHRSMCVGCVCDNDSSCKESTNNTPSLQLHIHVPVHLYYMHVTSLGAQNWDLHEVATSSIIVYIHSLINSECSCNKTM